MIRQQQMQLQQHLSSNAPPKVSAPEVASQQPESMNPWMLEKAKQKQQIEAIKKQAEDDQTFQRFLNPTAAAAVPSQPLSHGHGSAPPKVDSGANKTILDIQKP